MTTELALGDLIQTRKKHPCGSDRWQVIRIGADIKMQGLRPHRDARARRV